MLIEPTLDAATAICTVKLGNTVQVQGTLDATEVIPIEIPDGAGGWNALYEDGTAVELSSTNMQITASGSSRIRINKPVTLAAVGVDLI